MPNFVKDSRSQSTENMVCIHTILVYIPCWKRNRNMLLHFWKHILIISVTNLRLVNFVVPSWSLGGSTIDTVLDYTEQHCTCGWLSPAPATYCFTRLDCVDGAAMQWVNGNHGLRVAYSTCWQHRYQAASEGECENPSKYKDSNHLVNRYQKQTMFLSFLTLLVLFSIMFFFFLNNAFSQKVIGLQYHFSEWKMPMAYPHICGCVRSLSTTLVVRMVW